MNWEQKKIGDICEVTSSKRVRAENRDSQGIPFYCSKEIILLANNQKILESDYISENLYDEITSKFGRLSDKDILLTTRGTLGVPYLVKQDDKFYFSDGNLTWLRNFNNSINSQFVYYYLYSSHINGLYTSSATTIPFLTIDYIKQLKIHIPPFCTQIAIAKTLSNYDDLIEVNRRRIAILEEMAMRTYQEWFVHFRFPGHENTEFVDGLPVGWSYKSLESVIKFDRGCSYTSEEIDVVDGVHLINLKNIKAYGGYNYDGLKIYAGNYKPQHIVSKGDLIMGVTDMTQDRRTVGAVALIPQYENTAVISTDLVIIISELSNVFLYTMFRFGGYSKFFSEYANGSNVLHLKPSTIRKQLLLIPAKDIITKFDEVISPIIEEMEILTRQNSQLQQMRDRLLPQLMSGQLEVTP